MNREEIYDKEIEPLMTQIHNICEKKDINMLAEFYIPTDERPKLSVSTIVIDDLERIPEYSRDFAHNLHKNTLRYAHRSEK